MWGPSVTAARLHDSHALRPPHQPRVAQLARGHRVDHLLALLRLQLALLEHLGRVAPALLVPPQLRPLRDPFAVRRLHHPRVVLAQLRHLVHVVRHQLVEVALETVLHLLLPLRRLHRIGHRLALRPLLLDLPCRLLLDAHLSRRQQPVVPHFRHHAAAAGSAQLSRVDI